MAVIERDLEQAESRMQTLREAGHAVSVRHASW
jgi:hypothetical protein